jgi:hypothetical protein
MSLWFWIGSASSFHRLPEVAFDRGAWRSSSANARNPRKLVPIFLVAKPQSNECARGVNGLDANRRGQAICHTGGEKRRDAAYHSEQDQDHDWVGRQRDQDRERARGRNNKSDKADEPNANCPFSRTS